MKRKCSFFILVVILLFSTSGITFAVPVTADEEQMVKKNEGSVIRIHYQREKGDYEDYGLWIWNDVSNPSANWPTGAMPFMNEQVDDYGAYVDVELTEGAKNIGFLVVNRKDGDVKDGGDKGYTITSNEVSELWIKEGSDEVLTYKPINLPKDTVRIHYDKADFLGYGLWVWGDVETKSEENGDWPTGAFPFTEEQTDEYGAYLDIKLSEGATELGFLVVNRENGDVKDGGDKVFNLLDDYNRLWIHEGDDTVYITPFGDTPTGLVSGEVISTKSILLTMTNTKGIEAQEMLNSLSVVDENGNELELRELKIKDDYTIEITTVASFENGAFTITYNGRTVTAASGWRMIDELYTYDGNDLGATYKDGSAELKLWAPTASSVKAFFYDKEDASKEIGSLELTKGEKGVWSTTVNPSALSIKDVKGYYYQYEIVNNGVAKRVLDPYATSMAAFTVDTEGNPGPDGDKVGKAAIVDLSNTNPENFDFANIDGYEKREDAIIYEVHIRDFTSDPAISEGLHARWGSYRAFIERLDYIKSLGVTHVQLLPVMAWYYGDETKMEERELDYSAASNEYNWGYDPHSYFSPDGAYSENPHDPELRIKELKELIDAIHEAGMGVVLDVVYTHMAHAGFLNDIVPNYYFFQGPDGNFLGDFGNNLATNHAMAEKLMVDSVEYWFDEYKIDGMRFDMMGDATSDSIQRAYDAAAQLNPNALFIGEGWRTFKGEQADSSLKGMGADQDWMDKTNDVGVFSDEMRNELKSGFGSEGEPRFITGGARKIETIFNNIKAQPSNTPADAPGDMVQYIAAHDNLPLYDVIAQSIKKDPAIAENDLEIHKRIRIGNALIMTSQGTAFIHAGQEFGRTKQWKAEGAPEQKYHTLTAEDGSPFEYPYFVHDSYDSSDAINMFDWTKATDKKAYPINTTTQAYTEGLIKLRKSTNAFRLGDMNTVNSNVTLLEAPEIKEEDLFIAYRSESTDDTGAYYVFVNADSEERKVTLSENLTGFPILVDDDEAGTEGVKEPSGFSLAEDHIQLDPLTVVVIKVDDSEDNVEEESPILTDPSDPTEDNGIPSGNHNDEKEEEKQKGEQQAPGTSLEGKSDPTGSADEKLDDGMKQEDVQKQESDRSQSLPKTATNLFNLIGVGALFLFVGICIYVLNRKKLLINK